MNVFIKTGAAVTFLGALAACATPSRDVNVTRDLTHRYGEVQIAVNPKNPGNLMFVENQMRYTYACQAAKDPDCELVPVKLGGALGAAGGGGAGGAARPGGGGQAPSGGTAALTSALSSGQPKGFFTTHDFDTAAAFTSFDYGKTWKLVSVPVPSPQYPNFFSWGDPSVVAAPDGTFYFSYDNQDWGTPEKPIPKSMVGVSKSTDGGLTWTSPVPTGTHIDGPKMTVDLNTGTIYEASGAGSRQLVSSTDGVHWSAPLPIGGRDGNRTFALGIGGNSMSAAHGTIAFAYRVTDANACTFLGGPPPCIVFQTSTDSGATWQRHRVPVSPPMGAPTIAADPSKKGHFTVAVLDDCASKFTVYQTNDAGNTWTGPTVIAEDATKQYYHQWASYSPDGVFGLIWRARQPAQRQCPAPTGPAAAGATPLPYNIWAAISDDGGATFSAPLQVNTAQSPAPQAGAFGNSGDDYSGVAMGRGYVYVGWADWRPGDRQGFFRAIRFQEFKAGKP